MWQVLPFLMAGQPMVKAAAGGAPSLIDRTAGTNIGDLTAAGGLAGSFDGVTNQASSGCSVNFSSPGDGYVGKTLAAASAIHHAVVYGSNDTSYGGPPGGDLHTILSIYGKQGAAPSSGTNGTLLGTTGQFNSAADGNESAGRTISSSDTTTLWDHVWVRVQTPDDAWAVCGELELWKP